MSLFRDGRKAQSFKFPKVIVELLAWHTQPGGQPRRRVRCVEFRQQTIPKWIEDRGGGVRRFDGVKVKHTTIMPLTNSFVNSRSASGGGMANLWLAVRTLGVG